MKIRRTITIGPDVWAELKKEAAQTGKSASGIISEKLAQPDMPPGLATDMVWLGAFSYWCGRRTIAVGSFVEMLIAAWPNLSDRVHAGIQRDLEDAFAEDEKSRADNSSYKPLGDDCDRALWERVRKLWGERK